MNRISWNIHATAPGLDRSKLFAHLRAIQPAWVLAMDDLNLCKQIKAILPNTNVIYRDYPDEEIYKTESPQSWVNRKVGELGGADIWCYTINEAGFSDQLLNWFTAVIELASRVGLKVVIGNFSVGTPEASDWGKPAAVALLQTLHKHRDIAVLALHEYAVGVITSGFLGGYPDNAGVPPNKGLIGRNLIPPENWPKAGDLAKITRFHMGRFKFLFDYCKANGIPIPRVIITEWGFDDVSDIKAWTDKQPQTPPYTTLRGWKSHVNAWRKFFPQWSGQQALFEQLKYSDLELYLPNGIEGLLLYAWCPDSKDWDHTDYSRATEFLNALEDYAKSVTTGNTPPIEPPPVTPPTPPINNALLHDAIIDGIIARDALNRLLAALNKMKE